MLQQEWLPLLSTRLLLECSSPVRAQNPDPLALPQSCPPSVMHLVDIPQSHGAQQVPEAMSAASRGVGNSTPGGSMVGMLHRASFSSSLGHSPTAFPSLGEAVLLVRLSMPVTCRGPVFALPHCLNKRNPGVCIWTVPVPLVTCVTQQSTAQSLICPIPHVNKGLNLV